MPQAAQIRWARYLAWGRVWLSITSFGLSYASLPNASNTWWILMGLYSGYSLVLAARKGITGILGLLALFGDTIYFLALAALGTERLLWMASFFLLFVLAEALVSYSPVEMGIVTGVSAIFCAMLPYRSVRQLEPVVLISGALACSFSVTKRRLQVEMSGLRQKLEDAIKAADKARDLERQRIAEDFHDGPLQSFISLQMRLEILRKLLERNIEAGMEDLKQLQTLAQTQVRDLRVFLHSMRPVDVDGANLVAAARRAAESFQKESGIPVTFLGSTSPVGLPDGVSGEVLQMLREALHNVQKHAGATRVAVTMEKNDRGLEISVDDNGHGFNFAGSYTLEELELLRLGPASLKRRARSLNADLLLESRPGRGAGLKLRIPLQ